MIWNDSIIKQWASGGGVAPYKESLVNPASVDLKLANEMIHIVASTVLDASRPHKLYEEQKIRLEYGQKFILQPGTFVLASSVEDVKMPHNAAGMVMLKSTPARKGLGHTYAGFIDPGFEGNITFEIFSHVPVVLTPGEPICQLVMMEMKYPPNTSYAETGRYQFQQGPTTARPDRGIDPRDPNVIFADATLRPAG